MFISSEGILSSIEVSGMSFMQSINIPLTVKDTATLSGQMVTKNGIGSGSISIGTKRLLSDSNWVELKVGAGDGPVVSLKGFRTLSKKLFSNGVVELHFTPQGIVPVLVGSMSIIILVYFDVTSL